MRRMGTVIVLTGALFRVHREKEEWPYRIRSESYRKKEEKGETVVQSRNLELSKRHGE